MQLKAIANEILKNGQAYENLRYLTKQIGPRLAGSEGMVKSEQWGLRLMRESGADTAWLQELMVPHWDRGGKDLATAIYTEKGKRLTRELPTGRIRRWQLLLHSKQKPHADFQ